MFIIYAAMLVIGGFLLVADLVVGSLLVKSVIVAVPLAVRGVEAAGRVTRVDFQSVGRSAEIQVAYETPGGKFLVDGSLRDAHLGDMVPVRYHPARPAVATTLIRPWLRAFVGIPTALGVAAAAAGMLVAADWYFTGTHSSIQFSLGGGSFFVVLALSCGYYAAGQYAILARWRRMVQVEGKAKSFDEHSPVGPGVLISFKPAEHQEKFWAPAGAATIGIDDTVTVYYDPARPAVSATVQTARDVRAYAIAGTVAMLALAILAVVALTAL